METTRSRIIGAADALFYEHGLRSVSVDAISERAGVTKRSFYYHFESKDELIAAYLEARDAPTVERYRNWLGDDDRPLSDRIMTMFSALAEYASRPNWRGCIMPRGPNSMIFRRALWMPVSPPGQAVSMMHPVS